ncbi:MAG: glycosyltransferase family 4 protein [Chitinophagaceae bacterium]
MNILIIADPHIPIPPKGYGGTERIVHLLCSELQKKSYRVDLIAAKGSKTYGGKLYEHNAPTANKWSRIYRKIVFQFILWRALRNNTIIINFGRVDYLWLAYLKSVKILASFANPLTESEIETVKKAKLAQIKLAGISKNHVKGFNGVNVLYNGISVDQYKLNTIVQHDAYLAFLGRLTYNKGVDTAIRVANITGLPLRIAGNISKEEGGESFFREQVQPYLNDRIQWVGEINDEQKNEFLGNALATLFPIRWEEPFGIVMIESLACGTPVIANNIGSVPEIIENEKNGFICNSESEMIAAIQKIQKIDRKACRVVVEEKFSGESMVSAYLSLLEIN